jgi:hypothetical protein
MGLLPRNPPEVRDERWRRVGSLLTALHEEYEAYRKSDSLAPFEPSSSLARIVGERVVIDAAADGDVGRLVADLENLGAVGITRFRHAVSAQLPLGAIPDLAELTSLRLARPAMAMLHVGSTTSQGDPAMMTDAARNMFGVDGTGVTVGALSDSYDSLGGAAADVASEDLPSGVVVLEDSQGTDEARAILQLIHDVAPGASLGTHTAYGGQANFALGIQELAGCPQGSEPGCTPATGFATHVIVDDVLYFAEPFFQDGIVAQAVDSVVSANVFYFSAAGNSARSSYESPFISTGTVVTGTFGDAHDFDPGLGVDTYQKVTIPAGETVFSFQWNSPFFSVSGPPGSPNDLDICVFDDPPNNLLGCAAAFNVGGDPVEIFSLSATGPATVNFVISNFDGPDPGFMKWVGFDSGVDVMDFDTASSTLVGSVPLSTETPLPSAPIRRYSSSFPRRGALRLS